MTLPWIIAGAAVGLIAGPRMRASVFSRSTEPGQPPRRACPACGHEILPDRWRWRSLLPVTGRCPSCRTRIGPYPLLVELVAGLALAVVAVRASSAWELAALAWLALLAVPLAFIDAAVRRLPDPLTAALRRHPRPAGCRRAHQPPARPPRPRGHRCRRACLLLPGPVGHQAGRHGPGGRQARCQRRSCTGWISWQALLTGTFIAFALAGVYGGGLLALHRATRTSHLPLGPFILIGTLAAIAH